MNTDKANWISVIERLPDKEGEYLVAFKTNEVSAAYFRIDKSVWLNPGHEYVEHGITHWMPLPEPPK